MHRMLLVFSHELTPEQIEDARTTLNINEFVPLPSDLQKLWQNIPPADLSIIGYMEHFRRFVKDNADKGGYALIQGDVGAVYLMVNFAFSLGLIPVYATTERDVLEKRMPDNSVISERIFKHKIFRRYEKEEMA